ncbi:MAG TPA: peptidylprolyl isomerase [Thermoanaerobaculia bacterium]|nr:peptidylprolyl isomerase [Thermoanaerobaculia bacterium]
MSSARPGAGRGSLALLLLALLGACGEAGWRLPPEAVARFDGQLVTWPEFAAYVERATGEPTEALPGAALAGLFEQYLDERLLAHRAVELGVAASGEGADPTRRLLDALPPEPVTDEQVARRYREQIESFRRPERVRLRQLLFESREQAEEARAELGAGAAFEEVAARRLPELGAGAGRLGELTREDLPPSLAEVVFAAERGSVTPVQVTGNGYNVFYVEARMPAETTPLAAVAVEIRETLEAEARGAHLQRLAADARHRYNLVLAAGRLPFTLASGDDPAPAAAEGREP